jgi:hypothetical protein
VNNFVCSIEGGGGLVNAALAALTAHGAVSNLHFALKNPAASAVTDIN